jgi:hypothetical protein
MERRFLCYFEGQGDEWEAISVDYDIAVCGRSLDEVKRLLKSAILSYIEDAGKEEESERERLLNRRMPWTVHLGWKWRIIRQELHLKRRSVVDGRFDLTCPA